MKRELNLSSKQIYNRLLSLKKNGYDFTKVPHADGNMFFDVRTSFNMLPRYSVSLGVDDVSVKAICISDLHLGSEKERLDLLNEVYEYATSKGIHIIINAGDLIDGISYLSPQKISNPLSQLEYALDKYPYDDSIINLLCLGNHDINCMQRGGLDVGLAFSTNRPDFITFGNGVGLINMLGDQIAVKHKADSIKHTPFKNKIILSGHKHRTFCDFSNNNINIYIPPLCEIFVDSEQRLPGALELKFKFCARKIETLTVKHIIFQEGPKVVSEIFYEIPFKKHMYTEEELSVFQKPSKQKRLNFVK